MKKLHSKASVHPSPPPLQHHPPSSDLLDFLPAAILVLTAALTADDREVLAYLLLSCSAASSPPAFPAAGVKHRSPTKKGFKVATAGGGRDHPPAFGCSCFGCYMSFWVRWDSSPNRQLIHEIIDAFEDWDVGKNRGSNSNKGGRREKRKKSSNGRDSPKIDRVSDVGFLFSELGSPESADHGGDRDGSGGGDMEEKGSVKKLVSFIGERIWGVWG